MLIEKKKIENVLEIGSKIEKKKSNYFRPI